MSFTARLSSDLVAAEAGSTVPVTLELVSRGEAQDRFEIEVEGLDPEWTALPVPSFTVEAGETHIERFFFKPPRASESLAGNYPFVLRVRSLNSGESRTVQGVLQIKPYNHLSMDITPKKGYFTPTTKHNDFTLTIMNLGNTEQTLQLFGSDPEEECAFEFEQDQVTIGPGHQREVTLVVNPTSTKFLASSRLYGFSVTARNIENPSVAVSAQAQLEHRPVMTIWRLMFLVVLGVVAGLWLYFAPKPPSVSISVDKSEIQLGEQIRINWVAQNATHVNVKVNNTEILDASDTQSSTTYAPTEGGTVAIEVVARRDNKQSAPERVEVVVNVPEPVPDPQVTAFTVDKTQVRVGESVILKYKFNEAVTKAFLQPLGRELPLTGDEIEIPITSEGERTFTVIAENRAGKTARKSVTVRATQGSQASIVIFRAEPSELPPSGGVTKLIWQLTNAVRVEITPKPPGVDVKFDPSSGENDYLVEKTTTFTLTGYDANGRTVTSTVTVAVQKAPDPAPSTTGTTSGPPPTTTGTTAGTTGATTATTGGGR